MILTLETGGFDLALNVTIVLPTNPLIKCASHPKSLLVSKRSNAEPDNRDISRMNKNASAQLVGGRGLPFLEI